ARRPTTRTASVSTPPRTPEVTCGRSRSRSRTSIRRPGAGSSRPPTLPSPPERRDAMDFKIELVLIPVSDVDRAKAFYTETLGFDLDVDTSPAEAFRVVQMTPPGSAC